MQFMFETEVHRIFSTPIGMWRKGFMICNLLWQSWSKYFDFVESTLVFASHGDQIGLAKLVQNYRLSNADGHYISTKAEGRKFIKLKVNEIVLQVNCSGYVSLYQVLINNFPIQELAAAHIESRSCLACFSSQEASFSSMIFSRCNGKKLSGAMLLVYWPHIGCLLFQQI